MWIYIYHVQSKKIYVHEADDAKKVPAGHLVGRYSDKAGSITFVDLHTKEGELVHANVRGRNLAIWLEEQDDDRAVEILSEARLEKVYLRMAEHARALDNLATERDMLMDGTVEVVA